MINLLQKSTHYHIKGSPFVNVNKVQNHSLNNRWIGKAKPSEFNSFYGKVFKIDKETCVVVY